jgi:NDP-sugar pyrophosphorylase family protein
MDNECELFANTLPLPLTVNLGDMAMIGNLSEIQAVILAGGLGTRLRPAVADLPKVLAPVLGRPWLLFLLDQLAGADIRQVVLLTGYKAGQVQEEIRDTYRGMCLTYSAEPTPLGTAGAVRAALPCLTGDAILLMNGDSYCAVDLSALREFHCRQHADITMVLAQVSDASRFGTVRIDVDERVIAFDEKTQSGGGWINAGVYFLAKSLIEEIAPRRQVSLEKEMFLRWIGRQAVYAFRTDAPFLDIGTPESYAQAAEFFSAPKTKA